MGAGGPITPSLVNASRLLLQGPDLRRSLGRARRASAAEHEVSADTVAIKEGADLDLSCPIVVQNEDMIISWSCFDEPANIRSSRIHVTDSGKLRIRSAKVGDSCNYRCEAADGHGTLSIIIKVIVVDRHLMEQLAQQRGRAAAAPAEANQTQPSVSVDISPAAGGGQPRSGGHEQAGQSNSHRARLSAARGALSPRLAAPNSVGVRMDEQLRARNSSDIEMVIEPAEVHVARNKTFNLECRVMQSGASPGSRWPAPQIIWLKEFAGPRPNSTAEALEQNLIQLDGTYYHSLNWPRSITYSHRSTGLSSALLIRNSNYLHSGNYACFAGYPPPSTTSLMSTLEMSNPSPGGPGARPKSLVATEMTSFKPKRYKIVQAKVRVDDDEGEARLRAASHVGDNLQFDRSLPVDEPTGGSLKWSLKNNDSNNKSAGLLSRAATSNSWLTNVAIAMTLLCTLIIIVKLIRNQRLMMRAPRALTTEGTRIEGISGRRHHHHHHHHRNQQQLQESLSVNKMSPIPGQIQPPRQTLPKSIDLSDNPLQLRLDDVAPMSDTAHYLAQAQQQTGTKQFEHIYSEIAARDS